MRTRSQAIVGTLAMLVLAACAGAATADEPRATCSPDTVLKGAPPTIMVSVGSNDSIMSVRIGGEPATLQSGPAVGKASVLVPKRDNAGQVDVEVYGKGGRLLGRGRLTYVDGRVGGSSPYWVFVVYVLAVAGCPWGFKWWDIRKSYAERQSVIGKLPPSVKPTEIKELLVAMDDGPTGFIGLTRGVIAVTLILILGLAILHLIMFGSEPTVAERLLTMLAGALTAVIGFYFGSKATKEGAALGEGAGKQVGGARVPRIVWVEPEELAAGQTGMVFGEEFGRKQGTVTIGDKNANVTDWKDNRIEFTFPAGLQGPKVKLMITSADGTQAVCDVSAK